MPVNSAMSDPPYRFTLVREPVSVDPRPFTTLLEQDRDRVCAEAAILAPEIFAPPWVAGKYFHVGLYLLREYGILCPQVRDLYSAGASSRRALHGLKCTQDEFKVLDSRLRSMGDRLAAQVRVRKAPRSARIPQALVWTLLRLEPAMHRAARDLSSELFEAYWGSRPDPDSSSERLKLWIRRADDRAEYWSPSTILFGGAYFVPSESVLDGAPGAAAGRTSAIRALDWNARYERSKPRLVRRIEALLRLSRLGDLASAEWTIAAVQRLPAVGLLRGSLSLENRTARRPGDSDFLYTLSVSDQGFELGYHESVLLDSGQRQYSSSLTLMRCEPEGRGTASTSQDDEALATMREHAETIAGRPFDDHEWQAEVEAASENPDIDVPNGIEKWLEMLPVDDNGDSPESLVVRWGI